MASGRRGSRRSTPPVGSSPTAAILVQRDACGCPGASEGRARNGTGLAGPKPPAHGSSERRPTRKFACSQMGWATRAALADRGGN
eukprot:6997903-Lingulodinium_polyedra.AAC.1